MFLAVFILAIIVSMPIVAIVLVTVASKREDAAGTLGGPARGPVQMAARQVLDFQSDITWRPATGTRVRESKVIVSAGEQLREEADDSSLLLATSALAA